MAIVMYAVAIAGALTAIAAIIAFSRDDDAAKAPAKPRR
jgi:hypothetical protein